MAGIYIHDMDMPKDCLRCPACQGDECWMVEGRPQVPDVLNKRPKWCPLVEVPAHGRLIDGDLLPWVLANTDVKFESYEDWEKLCDYIRAAPTIIPAEEDNNG